MTKKKKFLIFISFIFFIYLISNFLIIGNKNSLGNLKSYIPQESKELIKKFLFPYKYIKQLENTIIAQRKENISLSEFKDRLRFDINKKDQLLGEIFEQRGYGVFYLKDNKIITINKQKYNFIEYNEDFLKIKKHSSARSGSIYAEKINDKLILLSANGKFQYFNITDFEKEEFSSKIIESNIKTLIKYEDFYSNSNYGIKDLFYKNGFLYFSYNREVKENCFNTSILRAKMNYEKLEFIKFFYPNDCILKNNELGFTPHSAGGRMVSFNEKIVFSNGEYLDRLLAQDDESIFGKILMLDPLNPGLYKTISKGHRNVQGLWVDEKKNIVMSTEHGPMGGDEVNINTSLGSEIKNFGWPISSYGEHYGYKERNDSHKIYKIAPLHKSHKKYGFEEPIQYFVPSIGISQIVKFSDENQIFIFGSLGNKPSEGDMSLHVISIDEKSKKLLTHEVINIGSRVRDIINLDDENFLLTLETDSTIALLKKL